MLSEPAPSLQSLGHDSALLNKAINDDMARLKYDAAKFDFKEKEKDSIRRDYDWQNRVEMDQMRNEHSGDKMKALMAIDPSDPNARKHLNKVMSEIPPELFGDRNIQAALGYSTGQVAKFEQEREHEFGLTKTAARSMINAGLKDQLTSGMAWELMPAINNAKSVDEVNTAIKAYQTEATKKYNERDINGINAAYLSEMNDPSALFNPREEATPANKVLGVLKNAGYAVDVNRLKDPAYVSELLPLAATHLEKQAEINDKVLKIGRGDLKSARSSGQSILSEHITEKGKQISSLKENGGDKSYIEKLQAEVDVATRARVLINEEGNTIQTVQDIIKNAIDPSGFSDNGKGAATGNR